MKKWPMSAIRLYQRAISPFLPVTCRYQPTCSEYSHQAISKHGLMRGLGLTLHRLTRCTPIGGTGYDPVP